jgi:hypothetical protein
MASTERAEDVATTSEPQRYRGRWDLGWLGAIIAVLLVTGVAFTWLFAIGGETTDEQAVRYWFTTPAGGRAPSSVLGAIHVGPCSPTAAESDRRAVMSCPLTTDAPTPTLHTCFVFAGGKVLRGGWQLASLDSCNALRFDPRTSTLVDLAARTHYRVRA